MLKLLTPAEYNAVETLALQGLPNRIIEAAGTAHFTAVGYPTRVSDVRELWRYAEGMHDGDLYSAYEMLGGLTDREFELVEKVTGVVVELTGRLGHRVVPGPSLLRAVLVYREIKQQRGAAVFGGSSGDVFEVGGGSGYVGALLILDGYGYTATDVCQAFYLWQGQLFDAIGVVDRPQMPWWEWMASPALECDIVTANHLLCELHPNAFFYTVETAKKMIKPGGQFLIEEWGRHTFRTPEQARAEMRTRSLGWGEIVATAPGDPPVGRRHTWGALVEMWSKFGGIPKSEDEKFLEAIGGVT